MWIFLCLQCETFQHDGKLMNYSVVYIMSDGLTEPADPPLTLAWLGSYLCIWSNMRAGVMFEVSDWIFPLNCHFPNWVNGLISAGFIITSPAQCSQSRAFWLFFVPVSQCSTLCSSDYLIWEGCVCSYATFCGRTSVSVPDLVLKTQYSQSVYILKLFFENVVFPKCQRFIN